MILIYKYVSDYYIYGENDKAQEEFESIRETIKLPNNKPKQKKLQNKLKAQKLEAKTKNKKKSKMTKTRK